MKKIIILIMLCLPMMAMAQKKVAVYVTASSDKVDNDTRQIIGGELVDAIVKNKQFKAVERTSDFLRQISREQDYQRGGNVDDDQISAIGKQFGVDYVCVARILPYKNTYYVQARMIDVENATVLAFGRVTSSLHNIDEIISAVNQLYQQLVDNLK